MLHFFSIRLRGWDLAALALIVSGPSMLICVLLHQGCFIRVLDVANRSAYQSQAAPGIVLFCCCLNFLGFQAFCGYITQISHGGLSNLIVVIRRRKTHLPEIFYG
jgi:hypothetical protein